MVSFTGSQGCTYKKYTSDNAAMPEAIDVADLDGDGLLDVLAANFGADNYQWLRTRLVAPIMTVFGNNDTIFNGSGTPAIGNATDWDAVYTNDSITNTFTIFI